MYKGFILLSKMLWRELDVSNIESIDWDWSWNHPFILSIPQVTRKGNCSWIWCYEKGSCLLFPSVEECSGSGVPLHTKKVWFLKAGLCHLAAGRRKLLLKAIMAAVGPVEDCAPLMGRPMFTLHFSFRCPLPFSASSPFLKKEQNVKMRAFPKGH